jgi:outer membrane protein assembly factor BamA
VWFSNSWRFAVFHDGGNALIFGDVPDDVDPSLQPGLAWSVGIGLRRITPIGPLRVDFAFRPANFARIPDVDPGQVLQVHFAVGAL